MRHSFQISGTQNKPATVEISRQGDELIGDQLIAVVEGVSLQAEILRAIPGEITLRVNGRIHTFHTAVDGDDTWIAHNGCTHHLIKPRPVAGRRGGEHSGEISVRAPMPAQVRAVETAPGDRVEKGQTLMLLEAMKMEIRIRAPHAGRVTAVHAVVGQTVQREQTLIEIQDDPA